jgi:hypothetical protein
VADKMKRFSDYYKIREDEEDKGLGDIDAMPNEDEILLKLAKIAINRHQDRLIDFFKTISKHDEDIKTTLDRYVNKRQNYLPKDLRARDNQEKDIIAPNQADMSDPD